MRRGREAGGRGGGGGGWGQRISPRPAPSLSGRPCVSAAYVRIFSSALRFWKLRVLLPVRAFPECCHKEAVESRRLPPWIPRGRKIEASFLGQETDGSNSFKTNSAMLVTGP